MLVTQILTVILRDSINIQHLGCLPFGQALLKQFSVMSSAHNRQSINSIVSKRCSSRKFPKCFVFQLQNFCRSFFLFLCTV